MFRDFLKSLLIEPRFRVSVTKLRFYYYVKIKKRLRTTQSDHAFSMTVQHNLRNLKGWNNRMLLLINPSVVLEKVTRKSSVLIIGPRTEHDLLILMGYGFTNVRGLDLISYSPRIDLGDMHAMPYADNSWDVVMSGWALSYSAN